jgi:RNA polymerase sigma-70 factor (ECF subfamily)
MFLQLKRKVQGADETSISDETLVARFLETGNKEFIGILFERYTHLVYGICLNFLKDKDQCKDAVMEIFESLFDKLQAYEVSVFKNWLYSVSRNHCLMMLRKSESRIRNHEKASEGIAITSEQTEPDATIEAEGQEKKLGSAVESLNTEQRVCVSMMYLEDKSYKDIAEQTGFSLSQVKSYIQNGKRNLKNYLLSRYEYFRR